MLFIRTYEIINSITSNHLLKLNPSPNAIPKSTRKPNLSLQSSLHCSIKPSPFPEFQRTLRSTQSPLTSVNIPIYLNTIFPLPSPNKLNINITQTIKSTFLFWKKKYINIISCIKHDGKLSFPFLKLYQRSIPIQSFLKSSNEACTIFSLLKNYQYKGIREKESRVKEKELSPSFPFFKNIIKQECV